MPTGLPPDATCNRDVAYASGGHPRQRLDLFVPGGLESCPLVIWIHGGEFRRGSKSDRVPLWLLAHGCAVASLDYRLSGDAVLPAAIEDVRSAVRWLRAHAAEHGLDAERFAAWGESAGGYLAAMIGVTGGRQIFDTPDQQDVASRVCAVVDFFGPTDFLQMDAHRGAGGMLHDAADSPESMAIGGPIQDRREAVRRVSPLTYVSRDAPPFLIVHGEADPAVPHHQSELLATALSGAGVDVGFYTVPGGAHGGFTDPAVRDLLGAFLVKHLALAG